MIWLWAILGVYFAGMMAAAWISLHPMRTPSLMSPGAMGVPQEDVEISSDGATLRGWWISPAPSASSGTSCVMILAHGYMMNRSELAPIAYRLACRGISCFMFDFRGHGRSGGRKCSFGLREARDVAIAVDYVRARCPGAKIGLLGSSMGAAACAIAAGDREGLADILILDSAYSRLSSAILGWWRFLGGPWLAAVLSPTVILAAPIAGFNPYRVDIAKSLSRSGTVPVLILHGDRDTLALPSEADRNMAAVPGPKTLVSFPGMGHCEARWERPDDYLRALFTFLAEHGFPADPAC